MRCTGSRRGGALPPFLLLSVDPLRVCKGVLRFTSLRAYADTYPEEMAQFNPHISGRAGRACNNCARHMQGCRRTALRLAR